MIRKWCVWVCVCGESGDESGIDVPKRLGTGTAVMETAEWPLNTHQIMPWGGRYHDRSLHLIDENAGGTSLTGLLCILHGEGIPNL